MINSSQSLFSAPSPCGGGAPYCELTGLICLVPSRPFSRAPEAIRLAHLCQFWYGSVVCPHRFFLRPSPRASGSSPRPFGTATSGRPPRLENPSRCFNLTTECRNISLLSIDYAYRPRLRIRLTLGGFTFPRNPCAYGDQDFHLVYRYSSRHSHFLPLHET